jgi:hypothetical protein
MAADVHFARLPFQEPSMQRAQTPRPVSANLPAPRPVSGPVPLSAADLHKVAGGLPRGGWQESGATTSQLPRGGW